MSVSVEVLPVGLEQGVLWKGLEDGLAIPSAHLPSWNVLHQLALLFTVHLQLLQKGSISLGEQQRIQRDSAGSHLDEVSLVRFVILIVDTHATYCNANVAL